MKRDVMRPTEIRQPHVHAGLPKSCKRHSRVVRREGHFVIDAGGAALLRLTGAVHPDEPGFRADSRSVKQGPIV